MRIRRDVQQVIREGGAAVALESTLITHGLPYPDNLRVAQQMEQAVRDEGAVPATVAVLAGVPTIGIDSVQLEYLAQAKNVRKCSRRDLPIVLATQSDGATTICGTLILAHLAGVRVFATGGLGGVHRGKVFDVSADLDELARTPMIVVCSGPKALLDQEATRERLETLGVPILGYGTDRVPAFYSRESDLAVDLRVESPDEVAGVAMARDKLGLMAAVVVGVPVPVADELPRAQAEEAIRLALHMAEEQAIRGEAVTPFLLPRITELTEGRSLVANRSLLINNARVAARVAHSLALARQRERRPTI
jgi:pseudouridine-5'-phosphate glycosidase